VREVRGLGLMWALELGPPAGRAARAIWEAIERRQPGLFAQLVIVPLFREHRILTQVAGHHLNVVKALPPLTIEEAELERFASALASVIEHVERRFLRSYARLGLDLGRRALPAATGASATVASAGRRRQRA
jgi:ornithine--oxo-acid transaminase